MSRTPDESAESAPKNTVDPARADLLLRRLQKNAKHLAKWRRNHGIHCYRLYDRELPEFSQAIDVYGSLVHVQHFESQPEDGIPREEILEVLGRLLGVGRRQVSFKHRRRQSGAAQYERMAADGTLHQVEEGGHRFLINLTDYLDTGLFLDHRLTRAMIRERARGQSFLNLFCYTGSVTVYAAAGEARSTTSVDMSRTYLDWARQNLARNGFRGKHHRLIQADCLSWLEQESNRYDLIFLDPPSFSNSKRMGRTFDVGRDHVELIRLAARRLAEDGVLYFSNNLRNFRMDREALPDLRLKDITRSTIPKDFERGKLPHQCWRIRDTGRPG